MKPLRVQECLSQVFKKVLETDYPIPKDACFFAVYHQNITPERFVGLVPQNDCLNHSEKSFAAFIKKPQVLLKNNQTVRQALKKMKKSNLDALPVMNDQGLFIGIVIRSQLLEKLYQEEHDLLLKTQKKLSELRANNLLHQKEIKRASEQISNLFYSDHLTGLPNFLQLREKITYLLKDAKEMGALLLINMDDFRKINEMFGSYIGDKIILEFSNRIKKFLLKLDYLFSRKSGDEFIILLFKIKTVSDVALIAREILQEISCPYSIDHQMVYLTASIGVSLFQAGIDNVEVLLANADIALEQAKEEGKNNYQFFIQSMGLRAQNQQKKEKYLRMALQRRELNLSYQPQIELKNNRVIGMEALLRWYSPELGLVLPSDFIALAEKMGLIMPIGAWVLHKACTQVRNWHQHWPSIRLAVNLSARQFQSTQQGTYQLINVIKMVLEETQFPSELLEVEVTESIVMKNDGMAMNILRKLKNLGVRISCDDFGTGYSSLNYLKRFPFDTIKIDKSFIDDLSKDSVDVAIIQAIILMAKQLKVEVIAEGVENKLQLNILQDLGCHIIQGFYFSTPLDYDDATQLLELGIKE